MGFYLRKTIRVGGVNLNLSSSGLGVSTGVRGFRVGMNGRGTYVHMGRGGLYYRQQMSWRRTGTRPQSVVQPQPSQDVHDPGIIFTENLAQPLDVSTATATNDEILEHFRPQTGWLWVVWCLGAASLIAAIFDVTWAYGLGALALLAFGANLFQRRRGVLVYDLEGRALERYQQFVEQFGQFFRSEQTWLYEIRSVTTDWKRNAGADNLIKRRAAIVHREGDPSIRTNLSIPCLSSGVERLYFLPDMVVARQGSALAAYSYADLIADVQSQVFIEDTGPPSDAQVVGHSWQFTRKDGGPDRRFNNNRQLPRCLYQTVMISLGGAFQRFFSKSTVDDFSGLNAAIRELSALLVTVRETSQPLAIGGPPRE